MRWFICHCILLVSLSVILAAKDDHPKQKRDLDFVKNLVKSKIFGSDKSTPVTPVEIPNKNRGYKIFRIPGFNKVLVKAVPKVMVAGGTAVPVPDNVGVIAQDPAVALVSSYLGTKTSVETINALEGVKNLLESGILTGSRNSMPVKSQLPYIRFITAIRNTESLPISPVMVDSAKIKAGIEVVQKPTYVLSTIAGPPLLGYQIPKSILPIAPQPMVPVPNIVKTYRPVQVPIPIFPNKYSYKQSHGDETMTTYTANDDHNVIVTKSDKALPLPPFIAYRLGEVLKLGTQMVSTEIPVPVMSAARPPAVEFIHYPKINPYRRVTPQMIGIDNNYTYKQIHNDGTMTDYSSSGIEGSNVQIVTGVGGRPVIPAFITDRLEKVVASTASSKLINPVILTGASVPTYGYSTMISNYPVFDTNGEVKVQVRTDLNRNNYHQVTPPATFSYDIAHKDRSMNSHNESSTDGKTNVSSSQTLAFINRYPNSNRNQNLYTNDDALLPSSSGFSYNIVHKDGSITSYQGDLEASHIGNNRTMTTGSLNNKQLSTTGNVNNLVHNKEHLYSNKKDNAALTYLFSNETVHVDSPVITYPKEGQENEHIETTVKLPSGSFSYKSVHSDVKYDNSYTPVRPAIKKKAGISTIATTTNNIEKNNVNSNKLPHTSSGFSYKLVHSAQASKNDVQGSDFSSPATTAHNAMEAVNTAQSAYSYKLIHNALFRDNNVEPTLANVPHSSKHDKISDGGSVNITSNSANIPILTNTLNNNSESTQDLLQKSSLSTNPIVVLDDPIIHQYQQNNSNSSSTNIKSNQNNVKSATATRESPSRRRIPAIKFNRGDIPDTS